MANIIAYIRKEVEKGNTLLSKKGEFVNPEKLENTMRKAYVKGLNNGSVSFDKPFAEYQQDEIEKLFVPVSCIGKIVEQMLDVHYIDTDSVMPNPCEFDSEPSDSIPEPQESIAQ